MIKREYFDAILNGKQTEEERRDIPFFRNIFSNAEGKKIIFKCGNRKMTCDIETVRTVPNPYGNQYEFLNTENIIRVKIKNPKLIMEQTEMSMF